MKNVSQTMITQLLLVLPQRFNKSVAVDVANKIQGINPSGSVDLQKAKQNRLSVSNYWTCMFGTPLNSERGLSTLRRLSSS